MILWRRAQCWAQATRAVPLSRHCGRPPRRSRLVAANGRALSLLLLHPGAAGCRRSCWVEPGYRDVLGQGRGLTAPVREGTMVEGELNLRLITGSGNDLFGLDDGGVVWRYDFKRELWVRLKMTSDEAFQSKGGGKLT